MLEMKLITTLIFVNMNIISFSQESITILARAEINNKFGCIDTLGNEIVPIKYDDLGFWGNNLIPVNIGAKERDYSKTGGKWGYCNNKGLLTIPLKFAKAESFYEGIAAVQTNKKWGFIDTTGKYIINPKYDAVRIFREGLCGVSLNGKWGYINNKGEEVISFEYGEVSEFKDGIAKAFVGQKNNEDWEEMIGNYCLINSMGKRICEPKFKAIWNFSDGIAKVEVNDSENKYSTKKGFINTNGEIVVPLIYDVVEDFSEGLAAVGIKININEGFPYDYDYKYGYVNQRGEVIIKLQFTKANKFSNGRAVVSNGKQRSIEFLYTDTTDNSIINHEDLAKYALIDKAGNFILDFDWRHLSAIDNNLYLAQRARFNGDGVIDIYGKTVIPFDYSNLNFIGKNLFVSNDGAGNTGEVQLININNKVLFATTKFAIPSPKYEYGLIGVRTKGMTKSGFVDTSGTWIIKDKYDMVWDFETTDPR
jgi:hypothetical protein